MSINFNGNGAGTALVATGGGHNGGYGTVKGNTSHYQPYIDQIYQQIYGRAPTAQESAILMPYIDRDQGGYELAMSQVAQQKQAEDNSPLNIQKKQQADWTAAAPQYADSINQITNSTLGRAATQDEVNHYGMLIASGAADPYTVQQFIQATPEYQNAQDTKFRQGLDTQLQTSDQAFFDRTKGSIAQQYALMGRSTSPALDVALTDLGAQLSSQRQTYLGQLSAQQYGGNKDAAIGAYTSARDNTMGQLNNNTGAIYQNYLNTQNRNNNMNDFNTQQNSWQSMYNQYRPQPGPLDYLNTGLNAVNAGANVAKTFAAF